MYSGPSPAPGVGDWYELSAGDKGIEETVAVMIRLVRDSLSDPSVKQAAVMAIQGVPKVDPDAYAEAFYKFAKARFKFVPDYAGVEELTSPAIHSQRILSTGSSYGDCDDYSMTMAAWLLSAGIPARFATIASKKHGGQFDHVRVEAYTQSGWRPMEATVKKSVYGQSYPVLRVQTWAV